MSKTSLRGVAKRAIVSIFGDYLPLRMKRLVHLASLGAYLQGSTTLDDAMISKLNAVMVLGSNDKALKLPVLLSRAIWDGKVRFQSNAHTRHHLGNEVADKLDASTIVSATPKWLMYGEKGAVQSDVEKLISIIRPQQEVPRLT